MDDHTDAESTHSADHVYTALPPLRLNKDTVNSERAYGRNIVPIKSYAEAQQNRAEQIMRMIQNKDNAPESAPDDTVHYLSPVSPLSDRTSYEGDYDYYRHMYNIHKHEKECPDDVSLGTESTVSCHVPELQCTVAIIKPDAMNYEDVVIRVVKEAGFNIISSRLVHLSAEQVSEIHAQFYGTPAFPHMVVSMSISPVRVLTLAAINAVAKWRELAGPDGTLREEWFYPMSMRTRFGIHPSISNAIKASENHTEADKETRYFNPELILEPIVKELEKVTDYCGQHINPTLLAGLTELVRCKPVDPILYLAEWLLLNNPYQPRFPDEIAVVPT